MEPFRGNAEQISARTAAVMNMKTMVMTYEDLGGEMVSVRVRIQNTAGFASDVPYCCGPTSLQTQKQSDPKGRTVSSGIVLGYNNMQNLTPPIKFKAQKLAAKFSRKCQVRCKVYRREATHSGSHVATIPKQASAHLFVAELLLMKKKCQRFLNLPQPPKRGGKGGKVSVTLGASLRRSEH
jgi:hypothetical protein